MYIYKVWLDCVDLKMRNMAWQSSIKKISPSERGKREKQYLQKLFTFIAFKFSESPLLMQRIK